MFVLSRSFSHLTTVSSLNPLAVSAQYAVRGELVLRAMEMVKENNSERPIIFCNIGNPQDLGQVPLSFPRAVLALCNVLPVVDKLGGKNENGEVLLKELFAEDAIQRAKHYLKHIHGGTGAYSTSHGVTIVRKEVADWLQQRDGHPSDPDNIYLTDGASSAVRMVMNLLIRGKNDGILTPIPQYPLYSATIALQGGSLVPYFLDEDRGFSTTVESLKHAVAESKLHNKDVVPRALVVINPGNPTGSIISEKDMREIVLFCIEEKLILLADEVYQENVWGKKPFLSFKKIVCDMHFEKVIELISFHSVSKGYLGECGRRGGYMELLNIDPAVAAQIYKLASISLCSNIEGQIMVGLMVNPPKKGDASYEKHIAEKDSILASLKRRAIKLSAALSDLPGVFCPPVDGALYMFPRIELSRKAIAAAEMAGKAPDVFYCLECLNQTGIVVVPGSGFGQAKGTFHFRTTILPSESQIDAVISRFRKFHLDFIAKYA